MADIGDLKSPAIIACGFESHLGYHFYDKPRIYQKEVKRITPSHFQLYSTHINTLFNVFYMAQRIEQIRIR